MTTDEIVELKLELDAAKNAFHRALYEWAVQECPFKVGDAIQLKYTLPEKPYGHLDGKQTIMEIKCAFGLEPYWWIDTDRQRIYAMRITNRTIHFYEKV